MKKEKRDTLCELITKKEFQKANKLILNYKKRVPHLISMYNYKKENHFIFDISNSIFNLLLNADKEEEENILNNYKTLLENSGIEDSPTYYTKSLFLADMNLVCFIFAKLFVNSDHDKNFEVTKKMSNLIIQLDNNNNDHKNIFFGHFMRLSKRHEDKKTYKNFNQYKDFFLDFYKNNFDFSNIKKNTLQVINFIQNELYTLTKKEETIDFLFSLPIDKDLYQKEIFEYINRSSFYINFNALKIMHEYGLDYITNEDNEKLFFYPFLIESKKQDLLKLNNLYNENDKGVFVKKLNTNNYNYDSNYTKIIYFDNIDHYMFRTLSVKNKSDYNPKYVIDHIEKLEELNYYKTSYLFSNIEDKIKVIKDNNLNIDFNKLITSFNQVFKNEIIDYPQHYEANYSDNIIKLLDFFIDNLDYNEIEQPILDTFHIIYGSHNLKNIKKYLEDKITQLNFDPEKHKYKDISYKELLFILKPTKNEYIPHLSLEKLLKSEIKKQVNVINKDTIYNGNSILAALFSPQGKYTPGMNAKRYEIFQLLEERNLINNDYSIKNNEKVSNTTLLTKIIKDKRIMLDYTVNKIYLPILSKELKKGFDNLDEETKPYVYQHLFQTYHVSYINDIIEELIFKDLTQEEYYHHLNESFKYKNTIRHNSTKIYYTDYEEEVFTDIIDNIKNLTDNSKINFIADMVNNNFVTGDMSKEDFNNIINSIKEKNIINNILKDDPKQHIYKKRL